MICNYSFFMIVDSDYVGKMSTVLVFVWSIYIPVVCVVCCVSEKVCLVDVVICLIKLLLIIRPNADKFVLLCIKNRCNLQQKFQSIMSCSRFSINVVGVILVLCLFGSCKKNVEKQTVDESHSDIFHLTDTAKVVFENPKITEYKSFVSQLDSADLSSVVKATEKFKSIFADQPTLLCDSAFVLFQAVYDSLENHLNVIHQHDTTDYEPLLFGDQASVPTNLKVFQKNLLANGFKISSAGGVTYIEQDRDYIARNFYTMVSPAMKSYLVELRKENKEGFALDETISISPRQLVDRTVWYERFIAENPDFVFMNNCEKYQKAYLTYLLCGYGKTVVYTNKETCELSDFYTNAYKYLILKYPASQTAQTVLPYYEAIKKKQSSAAQSLLKNYLIKGMIYSVK